MHCASSTARHVTDCFVAPWHGSQPAYAKTVASVAAYPYRRDSMCNMDSETTIITAGDPNVDRRVIYECNFTLASSLQQEFLTYLRPHMKEILTLEDGKLFDRATLCIVEHEGSHDADTIHLCARYRARSRFRLQEYFDTSGNRLRQSMQEKWGSRLTVRRRILAIDTILE